MDIVRFFISDQNCDPDLPGQHGRTLFHMAAEFGHLHIVKYLIVEHGRNPLHTAATFGHLNIVKYLTNKQDSNPPRFDDNKYTPLHYDTFNNTALHYAVTNGHFEIVKFLVEELKFPPDISGQHNMTPLQMARLKNHSDIAQYLQKHSVIPYIYTAIQMVNEFGYFKKLN